MVASVKTASGLTAGGSIPNGKVNNCLAELYYLSLVEAKMRRLILTTPAFFDIFVRTTAGAVADGVDIVCMPLPREMQDQVERVVRKSSLEVSPAAAQAAFAAEVESDLQAPDSI
jgi:hypothetical protein